MKKWRQLTSILHLVCPCRGLCFLFTWFILFGQGKKFIFIYLRLTFLHLDWTNGALRSYIMCSYRDENSTQFAFCNLTLTVIKKKNFIETLKGVLFWQDGVQSKVWIEIEIVHASNAVARNTTPTFFCMLICYKNEEK